MVRGYDFLMVRSYAVASRNIATLSDSPYTRGGCFCGVAWGGFYRKCHVGRYYVGLSLRYSMGNHTLRLRRVILKLSDVADTMVSGVFWCAAQCYWPYVHT